ncbi:hypothetical protein N5T16_26625 [Escherichia coli]|nr:hypothetical protein [Escherichia coli]
MKTSPSAESGRRADRLLPRRGESPFCRPLLRGFSPQWTFPMGARLPPHGTAVRGRTQNFLPGSWLKILWPVHLTLDRWNGRGLRLPPGKSTAGNRPQRWRQEGGLLRHQAQSADATKKGGAKKKGRGRKAAQPEPQPQPPEGEDYGYSDDIPF